jgi:hypothetical protein
MSQMMLESRIMHRRRTTVAASVEALETLEAEAVRRGAPLTVVLAEAIEEKAAALRRARRPRLGIGSSTDGRSAADTATAPIAQPPR